MLILGIESSCDETAAAVVRDGEQLLSNVISSQIATHMPYGGVVPELASREHLRAIVPVVREAVSRAGITLEQVDAFAVTQGPGLAGALLVGITYAKALAFCLAKPLIAVNHLEGHIHAVLLEHRRSAEMELTFPALALVVSGGHTHLYTVSRSESGSWTYRNVGHTLDDAAGEAFDKVAKLLALSYPGGPVIEALGKRGNPHAIAMPRSQIKVHQKRKAKGQDKDMPERYDFSFSGIKTAVLRFVETHAMKASIEERRRALAAVGNPKPEHFLPHLDPMTLDLLASFQEAIVRDLVDKTLRAAEDLEIESLIVSGGVASNEELRSQFAKHAERAGIKVFFPSRGLSTDNAAMIAAAAYPKLLARDFAAETLSAEASLALG
jgi:N6-L-threonylcarbamoyladenine synthase